ncbi:MAG: NifB/NifX family molybdenum-iron cluster-binding protein [Candidatus Nanopelagicaceae bacterium]
MIICTPVTSDGNIDPRWDRADWIAIAEVINGKIVNWQEIDVLWSQLYYSGTFGSHDDRIVKFLREHRVEAVIANHVGDSMAQIFGTMRISVHLGATGDAQLAVKSITT